MEDILTEEREYWWNEDYLELLSRRLDMKECRNVADIGCGIGAMSFALSDFFVENTMVNGVDIGKNLIKKARQKGKKKSRESGCNFNFVEGSVEDIPFGESEMDMTFCQTLLIHIDDPVQAIGEMKRITKNDGWIVAIEPNNLVTSLMFDTYAQTNYDIPDLMKVIEVKLRCEQGKRKLGLGFNSLGDALPDLFQQVGLEDIQIWISDKTLSLIPPYDTREKRVRAAQLVEWLETESGGFNYDVNYKYYKASGGKKVDFDDYWSKVIAYKQNMLRQLKSQQFMSSGGSLMYIVAGRVSK